ncbi:hypothetical protein ACDY96_30820 [Rhizobium mongolense]
MSDDAGQFCVGNHSLCWVHAERLLQKLMPATAKEERSLTMARDLVWRFYKALKAYKQHPRTRHHARPDEDLSEARTFLLPLPR